MAGAPARWTIERLVLNTGESPVQAFLEGLQDRDRVEALALLKLLEAEGNALRPPHSKGLGQGLFELRGRQVRLFYVFQPGRRVVLLDGIVKKQDQIPKAVMQRLRRFQRALADVEARASENPGR